MAKSYIDAAGLTALINKIAGLRVTLNDSDLKLEEKIASLKEQVESIDDSLNMIPLTEEDIMNIIK